MNKNDSPKKDNQKLKKDSTTDFFLNFISRQKDSFSKETNNDENTSTILDDTKNLGDKVLRFFLRGINNLNLIFDRALQSGLSIKILSFMMAVTLVFVISGGSISNILSTPNAGDYIDGVSIDVEGLQDDLDVIGLPDEVSVGLIGPSLDIYTSKIASEHSVYVDLSGLGEGEHSVELQSRDFPDSIQVMIVPQTVNVRITQKVTKTFDLGYRFSHEDSLAGDLSVSMTKMEHTSVEVRGSQDNIDKVHTVEAVIDLSGVTDSFSQESKVNAYDRSGKKLNVEVIPNTVKVDCEVSDYSKEINVVPKYVGVFGDGFGLEEIELSKDKVTAYGSEESLKDITEVYVEVDINGLVSDKKFTGLEIDKGKINRLSDDEVDASLTVGTTTNKEIDNVPINVINNDGYQIRFNPGEEFARINVIGVSNQLEDLTVDNFDVTVDLANLGNGSFQVPVNVTCTKGFLTCQVVSNQTLTITLTK